MKALLLSALAAALLVFASSANAATTNVRIGNPVASGKLLTALPSGAVEMRFAGAPGQVWTKSGVAPGFVSLGSLGRCLLERAPRRLVGLEELVHSSAGERRRAR
jgi:hypothetical protein